MTTANRTSPQELMAVDSLQDMLSRRTQEAMASLVSQKEEAIKAALVNLLGELSIDEVKRRCEFRTYAGDPNEYFCIDGDAVLQFYPIEFGQRQTKTSYFVTATQKVRKLK